MKACANHADGRGNARDRRTRKRWLLSEAAGFGGDGQHVPCRWCGRELDTFTVEADRWPLCGHAGGSYRRGNLVPACADCNRTRCSRRGAVCRTGPVVQLELVAREVAHAG